MNGALARPSQRPESRDSLLFNCHHLEFATGKITAESLKQVTRELEPGFAGVSFQVIRRNPRAYALYVRPPTPLPNHRHPTTSAASDDVRDVGLGEHRVLPMIRCSALTSATWCRGSERSRRPWRRSAGAAALAYDQQALRAKLLRLETEIILLHAEGFRPN